jgi:cytochrome c556
MTETVYSSSEYELVQLVHQRQSIMFEMQDAYWPLFKVKNAKSTDLKTAEEASKAIVGALGRFSELLLPGTANGEVPGSRAKPEVWSKPAEFAAALNTLRAAAEALSDAASSGDVVSFKTQFDAFASACVGCHGFKPSDGGRFRAPY